MAGAVWWCLARPTRRKYSYLQKARGLRPHPHVKICFQTLEMVMKVCSESVYQIDRVLSVLGVNVAWKQHWQSHRNDQIP